MNEEKRGKETCRTLWRSIYSHWPHTSPSSSASWGVSLSSGPTQPGVSEGVHILMFFLKWKTERERKRTCISCRNCWSSRWSNPVRKRCLCDDVKSKEDCVKREEENIKQTNTEGEKRDEQKNETNERTKNNTEWGAAAGGWGTLTATICPLYVAFHTYMSWCLISTPSRTLSSHSIWSLIPRGRILPR